MGNLGRWDLSNLATGYIYADFRVFRIIRRERHLQLIAFWVTYNKSKKTFTVCFWNSADVSFSQTLLHNPLRTTLICDKRWELINYTFFYELTINLFIKMLQVAQKLLAGYFNSELRRRRNSIQESLVDSRNLSLWHMKHSVFQNMKNKNWKKMSFIQQCCLLWSYF